MDRMLLNVYIIWHNIIIMMCEFQSLLKLCVKCESRTLTMALHQRQRQSCSLRTLPHVRSHTTHLALTGRFPSSHWWGIDTWTRKHTHTHTAVIYHCRHNYTNQKLRLLKDMNSPLLHPRWCHFLWKPAWSTCSCSWIGLHSVYEPWTYTL